MVDMQPTMSADRYGINIWYLNGKCHRADGPAVECPNGHKGWHLYGVCYSFEEWLKANTEISDEEKVMFKLQYG